MANTVTEGTFRANGTDALKDADIIKWYRAGKTVPSTTITTSEGLTQTLTGDQRIAKAEFNLFKATLNATRASSVTDVNLSSINVLKALQGASALSFTEVIVDAALAAILSVAIDQFVAINEALPKLTAALNAAQSQVIDLRTEIQPAGALDGIALMWAKATDSTTDEPGLTARAADLAKLAAKDNYVVPQN
jgi:hypothetical protein